MFDAQVLGTTSGGNAVSVYSPWMRREGDYLIATLDAIAITFGSILGSLEVRVYHKNTDDPDDGTVLTGSISVDSVGRSSEEFGPLKEMVRYRFTVSATTFQQEWAMFRMLSPVWFDAVKA